MHQQDFNTRRKLLITQRGYDETANVGYGYKKNVLKKEKEKKKWWTAKTDDNGSQISGNNQLQMQLDAKNKYTGNESRFLFFFVHLEVNT